MNKIIKFVEKYIQPIAGKMSGEKHIRALQNTFMSLIPLMTIGSFALLLISPPMDYTTMSEGFFRSFMQGWTALAGVLSPVLVPIYNVTMGFLSLYICIGLAYQLAKTYKMKTYISIATAVAGFIVICCDAELNVSTSYFATAGMFAAIVWTCVVFELYRFLSNKKVGFIDLGKVGVPDAIGDSLGNMVPVLLTILFSSVVNAVLMNTVDCGVCDCIAKLFTPVAALVSSPAGFMFVQLVIALCWWCGIHDAFITSATDPMLVNNFIANQTAFAAGVAATQLPHIISVAFMWCLLGSHILALAIVCAFFTKSTQVKSVGRLGLIPALFNISEPLMFGLPIVYNPTLLIPYVIVGPISAIIYYVATATHLINVAYIYPGWNIPVGISQLLCTMDVRAAVLAFVVLFIQILIWFPFVKAYDKQKLEEEQALKGAEE